MTVLIGVLFVLVLLVIEKREVRILFDETRDRALLLAKYMADVNLQPLVRYDQESIQENIDDRISIELPYIIFYTRSGEPLAANSEIKSQIDVYCCSQLLEDADAGDRIMETKVIIWRGTPQRVLEVEIPVFLPGAVRKWASVKIGHSLEPVYNEIKKIRQVLMFIGLAGLFFGIAGGSLLARGITRPLKTLVEGTLMISKGDFSKHLDIQKNDELGELARSFDEMTVRLLEARDKMEAANRKLLQAEKLASIGRLSATIAHEIRNPLTSVKLNIQKISESPGLASGENEHLELAMEGIIQIEKFIKEMLDFTRVSELSLEDFYIEQILDESLKITRDKLKEKEITVEKKYGSGLPQVSVDGDKLRQVFLNIIRNAEEAVPRGGVIKIATGTVVEDGHRKIRVTIIDSGPGINRKDMDNIFEPFFSTKASGFGLGLAIARKILAQHGGTIKAGPAGEKGSVFTILLPVKEEA